MTDLRDVPVLVLNWNGWDDSLQCLRHLHRETEAQTVWLLDNGSRDDRTCEVEDAFPGARVLRLGENFGWAGGYNRGLEVAHEEGFAFAYLLNNDARPLPNFLRAAQNALESDARFAAIGSVNLHDENWVRFDGDYHDEPGLKARATLGSGLRYQRELSGSGLLLRVDTWAREPFDERFFLYHEDLEWSRRVRRRGHKLAVCLDSLILHESRGSDKGHNAAYYLARNMFLLAESLPPATRRRARWRLGAKLLYHAARSRLQPRDVRRATIARGYADGWCGRFGPRPAHASFYDDAAPNNGHGDGVPVKL